jgi:deoxyribonuclease V
MTLTLHHAHPWNLPPPAAARLQQALRSRVQVSPLPEAPLRRVGGVDASFRGDHLFAAAVVLEYPSLQLVEQAVAESPLTFPYIPGLLSFREAPGILAALARLSALPDVLIVDGHGYAHPLRFGIACHLGVLLDLPTIGLGKSILIGQADPLGEAAGSASYLTADGEVIGVALRTRRRVKPVYVSVGHRVDLPSAVRVVLACGQGYRLPEPARLAHQLAGRKTG